MHVLTARQIFVKDTQSFNGTYLNGVRLSAQRVESRPFGLRTGDVLVRPFSLYICS